MNDNYLSETDVSATPVETHAATEGNADPRRALATQGLRFSELGDVVGDASFPEVDLALRRGRHIHKAEEVWYAFLCEAQPLLEDFYQRYGCELVHRSDGYFFLLPLSDALGKRHLSVAEMIVGQGLALAYLDPAAVKNGGITTREDLLNQLAAVMGTDALMLTLNPKRKRPDERVMQRTVRQKVSEALRRLSQLGFVELLEGDQLRLPPSLMRFAEPVRGLDAPSEALERLLQRGEISLGPGDSETDEPLDGDAASSLEQADGANDAAPPEELRGTAAAWDEPDLGHTEYDGAADDGASSERAGQLDDEDGAKDDAHEDEDGPNAHEGDPAPPPRAPLPEVTNYDDLDLDWDTIPDEET
jgi:chromosome partition protein MukE